MINAFYLDYAHLLQRHIKRLYGDVYIVNFEASSVDCLVFDERNQSGDGFFRRRYLVPNLHSMANLCYVDKSSKTELNIDELAELDKLPSNFLRGSYTY